MPPTVLSETARRGVRLRLSLGVRGGIGLHVGLDGSSTIGPPLVRMLSRDPRGAASGLRRRSLEHVRGPAAVGSGGAYTARVSFVASKHSPFLHNVRTSVAIFRAMVSLASCGRVPFATIAV